jgi:hypothetical protein
VAQFWYFYELWGPFTAKANHHIHWHLGDFELGLLLMAILSPGNVTEPLLSHIAIFMSHLGSRVKIKVECKLSIPIGAIVEISLTGFNIRRQGWKRFFFKIYHFMALT